MARRKTEPPAITDPVERYARSVVAGEVVTGRLLRMACERHLRDLRIGAERGLRFDYVASTRAIDFFPAVLRHSKGVFAGQPFELLAWQKFVIGSIFGWKLGDIRRFRTAFVSTARKNGKATIEAGIGLKALVDEGEAGRRDLLRGDHPRPGAHRLLRGGANAGRVPGAAPAHRFDHQQSVGARRPLRGSVRCPPTRRGWTG